MESFEVFVVVEPSNDDWDVVELDEEFDGWLVRLFSLLTSPIAIVRRDHGQCLYLFAKFFAETKGEENWKSF